MKKVFWIMLITLVITTGVWAQGTVTRGPLEFTFNADIAGPTAGNANLLWNGEEQLWQLWFWYRCPGDPFETPFPIPDSQSYSEPSDFSVVSLGWNNICGDTAHASLLLYDCSSDTCTGAGSGPWGQVLLQVSTAAQMTKFLYFDFDLAGDAGFDTASSLGPLDMRIQDGGTIVEAALVGNPHLRQVTTFSDLRDALNDASLTDLDGTGLPFGPGDFTGGYQRDQFIQVFFNVNPPIFADGFESGDVSAWSSSVGVAENVGVFVSSDQFFGDFGGLAFADATCQSLGTGAMPGSGPWVAWLSDSATDARDRIPQPGGGGAYVRASDPGTVIADDLADLTDGSLDTAIGAFDENGDPVTPNTWTGTNSDGMVGVDTCLDWTSNSIVDGGVQGQASFSDSRWTNWPPSAACDQALQVYCFGAVP